MKIMFICKYNCFRSKVAESYFRKINKNKKIKVTSAGFIDGDSADKMQKSIAKKSEAEIKGIPQRLSLKKLREQDLIVIVASDIPKIMFNHSYGYGKAKFVYWKIKDEQMQNRKNVTKTVNKIKKKVERLVRKLENEN